MSDYDYIPDELQDRDQWLVWNASNDTPRAPLTHPTDSYPASWSDPDEWLSFDEAVDRAERVESAGIGYVNAMDNGDYARGIFGTIDLDGCVEDGGPKDWVPSLQPFFDHDGYLEVSPSGDGIHIPIAGFDAPEWWSDEHFSDGEHEGVEVLTNKFSTFTGDKVDGAGDEPAEYGDWVDEWLREAYIALYDDDPLISEDGDDERLDDDDAPDTDYDGDEWLTEDVVEDALDAVDADVSYATWRDIGMALANHFGKSTGKRLFKQWSRGGSKWDSDAKKQADRIANDASDYNYGAPTLVYHAQQHGWDPSEAVKEQNITRSDGGATTASPPADGPDNDDYESPTDWTLDPISILRLAVDDPMHPAGYDDDGNFDIYPRDLRTNERGSYVWTLAKKSGNDDILARRHGPLLAYKPETSTWENDDDQRLREIANESLGSAFSQGVVDEVEANIRADPDRVKDPNGLGAPDETIMTLDGLLHLRDHDDHDARDVETGKREHHAVANLPLSPDWDADCPRWRDFIQESINTEHERKKFQEYCGYTLWRHAQTYGKAMLLVGPTDSGKSTALKVMRHVLGEDNVASESLQNLIDTRWGKAQLVGNIANIREEVTPSGLQSVESFKELTGGEGKVTAEFKGQKKFDFVVTQKFLFATNEVPSVEDADEAFYNRLLFVRFPNTVDAADQDPDLDDKLKAEAPGILNWMLDGLDRLLEQQAFTGERGINDKKDICDAFGGVIDRFTHHCLMVTGDEDDIVSKSDLHDLAHQYADDIDKEPDWSKQSGFTSEMGNQRGIGQSQRRIEGDVTDVLTGVRVKPEVVYRYDMEIDARTADTGGTDPTGLHNYQESDIRPGYDSSEERNVEPMVVKTVRAHDDPHGMPHDELVAALGDDGVSESKAESGIETCLQRGDIHEPADGVYRVT